MNSLPSIRKRLSTALIGISAAWGLTVSAVVWLTVHHEVDELLDHTLQESAEILFGLLSFNADQLPMRRGDMLPAPVHHEDLVWQVVSAQHELLLRSHRAPDQPLQHRRTVGLSSVGDDWRVYGMPFDATGRILYVAQRGQERASARAEAASISAGAALFVGLLCAGWLRVKVRQELESITEMSSAVAHFDPLRADAQLLKPTRHELMVMHDAVVGLGQRLAKHVANERAFSAHAAHALRTPLAGLVAQLAVAQRRSPPEAQPQLQRAREAADRLRRVVTALLTLFRSGGEVHWQTIDLAKLVSHLGFDALLIRAEGEASLWADPDLVSAALMNLFDNSLRHGATEVELRAQHRADGVHLLVSDNGSGIPPDERECLQAALDDQDYDARMGLGLMLADLVARAHGGRLQLPAAGAGGLIDLGLGDVPQNVTHHTVGAHEPDGPR
ncbi:MAG: HAMP domain-containing sensor histidine kinase [Burkholderiales bacterium]